MFSEDICQKNLAIGGNVNSSRVPNIHPLGLGLDWMRFTRKELSLDNKSLTNSGLGRNNCKFDCRHNRRGASSGGVLLDFVGE